MNFRAILALTALAIGCAGHSSLPDATERTAATKSSLTAPTLTPIPCRYSSPSASPPGDGKYHSVWDGSIPELYMADAYSVCVANNVTNTAAKDNADIVLNDYYGISLYNHMSGALAALSTSGGAFNPDAISHQWIKIRSEATDANGNFESCDPTTGDPVGMGISIAPLSKNGSPVKLPGQLDYVNVGTPSNLGGSPSESALRDIVDAELNLCIAQRLRQSVPGSAGGQALLYSEAEQRELLEIIRERAQIAMLQFGLLGQAFARPQPTQDLATISNGSASSFYTFHAAEQQRFPALTYFAWESTTAGQLTNQDDLTQMGQDFAASIQLHTFVTEELASLFARSRSAREPRTSEPVPSVADDLWGQGSWFQREMALLFGGDPLAITAGGAWNHTLLINALGPLTTTAGDSPGTATSTGWPAFEQGPYLRTPVEAPQVMQLLELARSFDDVWLQPQAAPVPCNQFDVSKTAQWIYGNVEADLETQDCASPVNNVCPSARSAPKTPLPIPTPLPASWRLLNKYGITFDHAMALATYLIEALSWTTDPGTCAATNTELPLLLGALQVGGKGERFDPMTGHLSPHASLNARSLADLVGEFTANAPLRLGSPSEMDDLADVGQFGFGSNACTADSCKFDTFAMEVKRTMGAMSAQEATREMLFSTLAEGSNPGLLNNYLANVNAMIGVLTGAIGTSVSIVPEVAENASTVDGMNSMGILDQLLDPSGSGQGLFDVTVTINQGDSFWANALSGTGTYTLYGLTGPYASDLATHPEVASLGGSTFSDLTMAAQTSGFVTMGYAGGSPGALSTPPESGLARIRFFALPLPAAQGVTLVVNNGTDWRVVAPNIPIGSPPYYGGVRTWAQYLAGSGALGTLIAHQAQHSTVNPTLPAYDGFDLPNPWVPPFNAELLGGSAGQTSIDSYMSLAKSASDEASLAVETALNDLQQQAVDSATAQAAAVRATVAVQQDRDALCGIGNSACDTTINVEPIPPSLCTVPGPSPACVPANDPACISGAALDGLAQSKIQALCTANFNIANVVDESLSQPAPSFANYAGGSLQGAFIAQWQAVQAASGKITAVLSTVSAAKAQIAAAYALYASQQTEQAYACSPTAMVNALQAGTSTSVSVGATAGFTNSGVTVTMSASFSPGPLIAQQDKCRSLSTQLLPQQKQAAQSLADAFAAVSGALVGFSDAAAAILKSSADIQASLTTAKLADQRAQLEATLTQQTLQTSTGIYRMYRSADMWRAKALIEGARRYALSARRAIEARYVIDLSTMSDSEPFVASPSLWADQIYTYDLNMPAAVGLNVAAPGTGAVYTNQVKDYVGNLQALLAGYAAKRPAAVASNEIDVVNLPGLFAGTPVTSTGSQFTDYTGIGQWSLHCPANATIPGWIAPPTTCAGAVCPPTTGNVQTACAISGKPMPPSPTTEPPDEVRLDFTLDPWGRLNGAIANAPFVDRFNARWGNIALNFVGTGIKDCTRAADPQGCYNAGFVSYNLTHYGPSWVTNYDEAWRLLNTPSIIIEGGKGLAAEVWLNPLKDGWSSSFIAPILRTEYALAPLGGAYELDFKVPPEVILSRIERVQLLIGSTAWVKEQQ
jgi:hypothetical protein